MCRLRGPPGTDEAIDGLARRPAAIRAVAIRPASIRAVAIRAAAIRAAAIRNVALVARGRAGNAICVMHDDAVAPGPLGVEERGIRTREHLGEAFALASVNDAEASREPG